MLQALMNWAATKPAGAGLNAEHLAALIAPGTVVRLASDEEIRDAYGRVLAYIWVGEVFVNLQMAADGLARPLPYPPNLTFAAPIATAAAKAAETSTGIWSCSAS